MHPHKKQSAFWWTRSPETIIYFVRELTGVFISIFVVIFAVTSSTHNFRWMVAQAWFGPLAIATLVASLIHTTTWLWVSTKITPFDLKLPARIALFTVLLVAFGAASYFLYTYLYVA